MNSEAQNQNLVMMEILAQRFADTFSMDRMEALFKIRLFIEARRNRLAGGSSWLLILGRIFSGGKGAQRQSWLIAAIDEWEKVNGILLQEKLGISEIERLFQGIEEIHAAKKREILRPGQEQGMDP